ncbi:hypothetical protein BGZ58_002697 [Dissophora ornata]|nr:hypothetical protein BGZ58_002697 [Dissophora ornata]
MPGSDNADSQHSHENWSYAQDEEQQQQQQQPALLLSFAPFEPADLSASLKLSMPTEAPEDLKDQGSSFDVFMDEDHLALCKSDQEGLQFFDQDCLDPKDEQPVVRLELRVLAAQSDGVDPDNDSALDMTRRFAFRKNAQLLLGRSPSCGSDEKARMRQTIDGQAEAENGSDDGLFANQVISKVHAALYEKDGQLILEDRHSTHGTFVNSEKISRRELNDFDRIRLGRCVVRKDVPYMPLEFVVRIQSPRESLTFEDCQETSVEHAFNESCTIDETLLPITPTAANNNNNNNEPTLSEFPVVTIDASPGTALITVATVETSALTSSSTVSNATVETSTFTSSSIDWNATVETCTFTSSATVSNAEVNSLGGTRKRKQLHDLDHSDSSPDNKRTALIAAAVAGMVVGSVGTVLTLASM